MKKDFLLSASLIILLGGMGGAIAPAPTTAQLDPGALDANQPVLFRTKQYVVQIIWRQGVPVMTVSQNGWRVLVDVRAQVLPPRGGSDSWTTYTAAAGDYTATVRVSPTGRAAIAVTLRGQRITEEYSTPAQRPAIATPTPKTAQPDSTVLAFQTTEYAVRVFRKQDSLFMNLYNKQTEQTVLSQVPVTLVNTTNGIVYRHDGQATIQAREDVRGGRSLLIIRDNAIQYRGEAF